MLYIYTRNICTSGQSSLKNCNTVRYTAFHILGFSEKGSRSPTYGLICQFLQIVAVLCFVFVCLCQRTYNFSSSFDAIFNLTICGVLCCRRILRNRFLAFAVNYRGEADHRLVSGLIVCSFFFSLSCFQGRPSLEVNGKTFHLHPHNYRSNFLGKIAQLEVE